jgi:biotin carboxyl carrier protein
MIFEVAVGGGVKTVTVVRKGALLHVEVDGRVHVVDARRVGEHGISMLVRAGTDGVPVRSVDAALAAKSANGDYDVYLDGRTVSVDIRPSTHSTRSTAHGPTSSLRAGSQKAAGPQRVTAPMPGKIVKVLVKAGDEVKARQGLVVVEAMKMENELRAGRDGRVREVMAVEGRSVDAGAVLLVVE